jgi:hypothetical protein
MVTLQHPGNLTERLFDIVGLQHFQGNPPPMNRMLTQLGFLKMYALDMAYLPRQGAGESA